jgi:hypothetical protein
MQKEIFDPLLSILLGLNPENKFLDKTHEIPLKQ